MKWINKTSLRKIKVNNESYLWKRGHYHLEEYKHSECVEKVIVFLEGFKNSPLQLLFKEDDNILFKSDLEKEKWCVGYPDQGVIWFYKPEKNLKPQRINVKVNLNRPAVIGKLIEYYISNGWNPRATKRPMVVKNALKLIEQLDLPKGMNNENEKLTKPKLH